MKKYFFSIVALFAVTFTVMTFSSCNKDDDEKKEETKEKVAFTYEASVSDDLLKMYDVEVVAKYGNEYGSDLSETWAFTDTITFVAFNMQSYVSGKKISKKGFISYKDCNPSITCNVKLKSNWKDVVASTASLDEIYVMGGSVDEQEHSTFIETKLYLDGATQASLEAEAEKIAQGLSMK